MHDIIRNNVIYLYLCSMNIIHIDNIAAEALVPYARLTEAQLLNRLHPEEGLFICESMKVIRVALERGMQPVSFLCEEKFVDTIPDCCARRRTTCLASTAS